MAATAVIGARRATFSTSGLLPVLVLALLLHAPVASARHWFWNDGLFPVAPTQETTRAAVAITAAQPEGASAEAAATPAPAAPASAAPAVSCSDAPVDPFIVAGAAPDPCAALAAEVKRSGVEELGLGFAAPSLFRACYSTFLFRKECDVQDLLSIANGFDNHYVYKHIALDSPDQTNLPSSIDIVAELRKIVANGEAGKYARLVDAHMAARRATLSLNDGHTMFDPGCFAGAFDLPLPLVAVVENGQQIIRVAPRRYVPKRLDIVAKVLHGFDFALYEGRQVCNARNESIESPDSPMVVAINRDKAEDFIRNWADKEVGFTRNLAARFTRSFARNVAAASPNGPMIQQLAGFTNATGYWKTHCAVPIPSPAAAAAAGTGEQASIKHADDDANAGSAGISGSDGSDTPDDLNVEMGSLSAAADGSSGAVAGPTVKRISPKEDFYLVYLVGGSTAVVWLHGFVPLLEQSTFEQRIAAGRYMEEEVTKALHTAAASVLLLCTSAFPSVRLPPPALQHPNHHRRAWQQWWRFRCGSSGGGSVVAAVTFTATRLSVHMSSPTSLPPPHPSSNASQIIIDVRGNGGGYVQAAYKAIRLLIGAAKVPDSDLTLPLDFVISTPYTENVIGVLAVDNTTAPHYYLGLYSDLNGTELASAFDYAPFRELRFTEAGRAGNYSAPFKFNHKGQLPVTEEQPVLGDRPFLVLSDGDCFSACAVLTHVLGKRHKVPMVTVGGLPNQPPDVSSSCLGFTLTEFYAVAHGLGKLAAMEPQQASLPLKVQGAVKMAFTSAYVDSEIPCEFEFLPSQHHVNYTVDLIAKPWAMWNEVAKLFDPTAA
ncbi:unnamed protein product [Closterium sp. NIES-53]